MEISIWWVFFEQTFQAATLITTWEEGGRRVVIWARLRYGRGVVGACVCMWTCVYVDVCMCGCMYIYIQVRQTPLFGYTARSYSFNALDEREIKSKSMGRKNSALVRRIAPLNQSEPGLW